MVISGSFRGSEFKSTERAGILSILRMKIDRYDRAGVFRLEGVDESRALRAVDTTLAGKFLDEHFTRYFRAFDLDKAVGFIDIVA